MPRFPIKKYTPAPSWSTCGAKWSHDCHCVEPPPLDLNKIDLSNAIDFTPGTYSNANSFTVEASITHAEQRNLDSMMQQVNDTITRTMFEGGNATQLEERISKTPGVLSASYGGPSMTDPLTEGVLRWLEEHALCGGCRGSMTADINMKHDVYQITLMCGPATTGRYVNTTEDCTKRMRIEVSRMQMMQAQPGEMARYLKIKISDACRKLGCYVKLLDQSVVGAPQMGVPQEKPRSKNDAMMEMVERSTARKIP